MFEPGKLYAKKLPPPGFVPTLRDIEKVALERKRWFFKYKVSELGRL